MAKKINVLKIESAGEYGRDVYSVYITKRQMMELPEWVYDMYHGAIGFFEDTNPKHIYTSILAKDELEAMMRFQKLWAALKSLEEN
jgi:hypothetical protein